MKKQIVKVFALLVAVLFLSITVLEFNAHARAGGGRSFRGSGSRSYSRPASPSSQPNQSRQQAAPAPMQQQQGGGFLRSMAGGLAGGMLGSMLFSSFAGAGTGGGMGGGGGGIGIFGIILIAGCGYLAYRYFKNKRTENSFVPAMQGGYQRETIIPISGTFQSNDQIPDSVGAGLASIHHKDPSFDENRFNDSVMDMFFKIQGAWMNRDLTMVSGILTDEMKRILQTDLDQLLRDKRVNRLENIAVRNVEVTEVWQEAGQDYITAMIYANLLDYTTEESTGVIVSGSKTDPVKFEEFWTFVKPNGNNPWRLTSISQA
ncbi:MAG: Tim44 domain-containing protein [Desulfuromonadaceae bacterium]|nr:Tim44 domain-containing protein [Desulfuromonadaceae bacterium]MDD5105603.1 Tim44 domain-containing protein [Desulfuromonadaceae bacterium]